MTRKRAPEKLTRDALLEAAGRVYFARGEAYFDMGVVQAVRERDGIIRATVHGTQPYKTTLILSDGAVDGSCSCPLGRDHDFCKHLVATGLAYIAQQQSAKTPRSKSKPITPKEVAAYLSKMEAPELVRIIMEQADIDDEFYAMLKLRVAAEAASSSTAAMRNVLRQAMTIGDFISWRGTDTYTLGVERVLKQLRTMLTPKHAARVIELAEYGMDLWEENIGLIDDSDGCMGMIRDELHELHLEACNIARPEPVALAERLARRAIASEWEMFFGSYEAYRGILGAAGRARYREIVEEKWNALPSVRPGEKDPERYGSALTLEHMMLAFAEEDQNLELAIRILSRDLSYAYNYLLIAQHCREARNYKLAREWAERGMAAFTDDPDSRLRDFLAEEYLRAKRPDDAIAMVWANFEELPTVESYEKLVKCAQKLKCRDFWREKAFAFMRNDVSKRKAEFTPKPVTYLGWAPLPPDSSLLVEILLWEKRDEAAWEEAQKGGCAEHLWRQLAKLREKEHPEDAIEIYRRQVQPLIARANNQSYEEAAEFLGRIHNLMQKTGQEAEFFAWLLQLKSENKRKRNFIKCVERRAWGK